MHHTPTDSYMTTRQRLCNSLALRALRLRVQLLRIDRDERPITDRTRTSWCEFLMRRTRNLMSPISLKTGPSHRVWRPATADALASWLPTKSTASMMPGYKLYMLWWFWVMGIHIFSAGTVPSGCLRRPFAVYMFVLSTWADCMRSNRTALTHWSPW